MGAAVTQVLMDAIAGEGIVTMTQGALGHSGAQGRARGFWKIVKKYPKVEVVDHRRRLGRDQGRPHLENAAEQVPENRRRLL